MKKEDEILHALGNHIWVYLIWNETKHGTGNIDGDFDLSFIPFPWKQEYHPFRVCPFCDRIEMANTEHRWFEILGDARGAFSKPWRANMEYITREFYEQNR